MSQFRTFVLLVGACAHLRRDSNGVDVLVDDGLLESPHESAGAPADPQRVRAKAPGADIGHGAAAAAQPAEVAPQKAERAKDLPGEVGADLLAPGETAVDNFDINLGGNDDQLFWADEQVMMQPGRYNMDKLPVVPPSALERARTNRMSTGWQAQEKKVILMSGGFPGEMTPQEVIDSCPKRCELRFTGKLIDPRQLTGADAVIFNTAFTNSDAEFVKTDWSKYKPDDQLWFLSDFFEAYVRRYSPPDVNLAKSVDYLMSYNTFNADSPFFCPMFTIDQEQNKELYHIPSKYTGPVDKLAIIAPEKKHIVVTWGVSHCNTASGRGDYARALKQELEKLYAGKDKEVWFQYGNCNHEVDPTVEVGLKAPCDLKCSASKIASSKFYFAGENTLCDGYMTEKQMHGLAHGAVPIVYADLSKEAQEIRYPPNSFISTYDFKSPAELAQYLYDLDHHDRAYKQFHAWRSTHMVSYGCHKAVCNICEAAHDPDQFVKYKTPEHVVQNWWSGHPKCDNFNATHNLWWQKDSDNKIKMRQQKWEESQLKEKQLREKNGVPKLDCTTLELKGFVGRIGNRMTQIVNGIGVAEKLGGFTFTIPDVQLWKNDEKGLFRVLFDFPIGDVSFKTDPNPEALEECELSTKIPKHICTNPDAFWDVRCKYGFKHRTRIMNEYLAPHLRKNLTTCAEQFKHSSQKTLVVHIRGGDARGYRTDNHPCHVQPTCGFYDDAIKRSVKNNGIEKILIASDGGSKCAKHIEKNWQGRGGLKVEYTNQTHKIKTDLFTDACALIGARHVVWARSGFSAFFMMLNPHRDSVFLPLAMHGYGDSSGDYCDVWNLNHGVCPYVKQGYFYYPQTWKDDKSGQQIAHKVDEFGGTCNENDLGTEPLRRMKK